MDNIKKYEQIARDEAKKSNCTKRKVGAILVVNGLGLVIGQGHNYSTMCSCNDGDAINRCPDDVIHAEIACLNNSINNESYGVKENWKYTIFITQPPCNNCIDKIKLYSEQYDCSIDIHVCEEFMKFDDDKLRYDLIPPEWETALAEILTYGAKKYKPNNWRHGEVDRYIGAIMRHWNAYRKGEINDSGTTMPHLWHMFTNVGFLITLENEIESKNNIPDFNGSITVDHLTDTLKGDK